VRVEAKAFDGPVEKLEGEESSTEEVEAGIRRKVAVQRYSCSEGWKYVVGSVGGWYCIEVC
jgi:hypothetical protein